MQAALKSTQKDLVATLEKQGVKFSQFAFEQEGEFLPTDSDWNYKDVPHLNIVHRLVDATYGMVGDDMIATINMQKILGIRFPLTVFNYQSTQTSQTYFASFFVYQLIIETTYQQIGPMRTRVRTNYAIGSAPFWQLFIPLLKRILKANFDDLMTMDVPMRSRRGELRKMGYSFKGDHAPYSFRATMKINEANLVAPAQTPRPPDANYALTELREKKICYFGRADHLGLRLECDDQGAIRVFPRTCPHEDASLDTSPCVKGHLNCPWHGRVFQPLAVLSGENARYESDLHSVFIGENLLHVKAKN